MSFVAFGVVTVMLGPLLPGLTQRWKLDDSAAGVLFRSFYMGQFAGSWFASRNLRLSLASGAALVAAGCCALAWTGFGGAYVALFVCGLGLGAALTAGNVIAGTSVAVRARALALLNVSWSIGAISSPLLVRTIGGNFFFVAAAMNTLAGLLVLLARPAVMRDPGGTASLPLPLQRPVIAAFVLSMMLFVGCESALGGWLPSFAERHGAGGNGAGIALCYWAAELAGRLLLAALAPRLTLPVIYRTLLVALLAAQTALLVMGHPSGGVIAGIAVVDGICLGPLYPLIVAFLLARTGQHPQLGPIFALAALGGAVLPWLTGVASTHLGGLRLGLTLPLAGAAAMLALSSIARREIARPAVGQSFGKYV